MLRYGREDRRFVSREGPSLRAFSSEPTRENAGFVFLIVYFFSKVRLGPLRSGVRTLFYAFGCPCDLSPKVLSSSSLKVKASSRSSFFCLDDSLARALPKRRRVANNVVLVSSSLCQKPRAVTEKGALENFWTFAMMISPQ